MNTLRRSAVGLAVVMATAVSSLAGGSGLNTVVVVNENSSNSLELANYYCEKRGVPPQNVLRINWPGGSITWTNTDFNTYLLNPLLGMLASRKLTNQVEYVLLSMDIPYRVRSINGENSTTSALFYGYKTNDCPACAYPGCTLPAYTFNAYAGSEGIFRQTPPVSVASNSWLVIMLTSSNLAQAKAIVDRGVASDYAFPTQSVYLIHNLYQQYILFDPSRDIRFVNYDDAVFDNRLRMLENVTRTNASYPSVPGYQLGSQFGLSSFGLPADLFAPGALADNLTSFGGQLFESGHQPGPLEYLNAGATTSYGTVIEPCAYLGKFASPRNYFYQARGFNAAECYYQSVTNPYQGILVGEPLAAPFAAPCSGVWSNPAVNAVLAGTTNFSVQFVAADETRPVSQVDLFVDGTFAQTLTNISPRSSNVLYVTIKGMQTNYVVPANASLKSVTSNLTVRVNGFTNATKVVAVAHGDRIDLRSLDLNTSGSDISLTVSNYIGSASELTTFLAGSSPAFLDTSAYGIRNYTVTNAVNDASFLQLTVIKTNGFAATVNVTNTPGNTDTSILVQSLVLAINTNTDLMSPDGLVAEDFFSYLTWLGRQGAEFDLRARSAGWPESQMKVTLTHSAGLSATPTGTNRLDENVQDLRPRNHLYVTAGRTNLMLPFPFNSTSNADGYHELTTVAYEGSHVRTQKRISVPVRIQNSALAATLTCLLGDTNTALEATLQFSIIANTNNITSIELFSTGGSRGVVSNQSSVTFSVPCTNLGVGLHPFYALVTRTNLQYRTATKWIRIVGAESPFPLTISGVTPMVSWPATAGRRYEILSTTNPTNIFSLRDAAIPTNSAGQWSETNDGAAERFYRVRSSQ